MGIALQTGLSGLNVTQRQLSTTAHNIANVNTPGFSRQRVDQVTQLPFGDGGGFIGTGVTTNTTERIFEQLLEDRVASLSSTVGFNQIRLDSSQRLTNTLSDPALSLALPLQNFFNSLQDVASEPTSITARNVVLSETQTLVDRFSTIQAQIDAQYQEVNQRLTASVDETNELLQQIADLNLAIVDAESRAGGQPANDLLDRRDFLIRELSENVDINTLDGLNGAVNIFTGNGQPLVLETTPSRFVVTGNEFDGQRFELSLNVGGPTINVTSFIQGGELGGVLSFREEVLDPARNQHNLLALGLADAINTQHRLGLDLDSELGGDLLTNINNTGLVAQRVTASADNAGNATFDVSVSSVSALTDSDYELVFDGTNYTLTRLSDGTAQTFAPAALPLNVDGFDLALSGGTPTAGDRFLLSPTLRFVTGLNVQIDNPRDLALAGPIVQSANAANSGTAFIENEDVIVSNSNTAVAFAAGTFDPITITYDQANGELDITGASITGVSVPYDPAADSGSAFTITDAGLPFDITFTFNGTPNDGDSFTLGANLNGISDNRNALLLNRQSSEPLFSNGTQTLEERFATTVSFVASATRQSDIALQSAETLRDQALEERQVRSGVNLDEEAANLIKFQQAYQASAQVIRVAQTVFDTFLNSI